MTLAQLASLADTEARMQRTAAEPQSTAQPGTLMDVRALARQMSGG